MMLRGDAIDFRFERLRLDGDVLKTHHGEAAPGGRGTSATFRTMDTRV